MSDIIEPRDFAYISDFVHEASAIVLDGSKEYLVESRLMPIVHAEKLGSIAALVTQLRKRPFTTLHKRVIEAMTTHETSFFRDVAPFDGLRTHKLPQLIERRAAERRLRIWCGAASSGQEPYSLAMMILEHFPALAQWDVKIFATDISPDILKRAIAGRYSQREVDRGLPASMLNKYLDRAGTEWSIKERVKKLVQFDEMNLIRPWHALPPMDIVFMRNVLIYFDVPTKKTVLGKIRRLLRPDGCLFLGNAETTINIDNAFVREPLGSASCYSLVTPSASFASPEVVSRRS